MLRFQMSLSLKFCFPSSLHVLHWVNLPLYLLLCILYQFLHFFTIGSSTKQILKSYRDHVVWALTKTQRHLGVFRGTQTAMMMVFCGFGKWMAGGTGMLHPDLSQGRTCPGTGGAISRQPSVFSSFQDCLSCGEPSQPGLHASHEPKPSDWSWRTGRWWSGHLHQWGKLWKPLNTLWGQQRP